MNHSAAPADASASGWAALRTTRRTPSAPMPRRRSHSAATNAGVSGSTPSGSGRMTKSLPVPCPFAKRMRSILPHRRPRRRLEVRASPIEPADPSVPAKPGALPPHEPARRADRLGARLVLRALAGQEPQHLLVAEGAAGGAAGAQAVPFELAGLLDEAGRPHRVDAGGDPRVQGLR